MDLQYSRMLAIGLREDDGASYKAKLETKNIHPLLFSLTAASLIT